MAKYPFLADGWFTEVEKLIAEHGGDAPADAALVMNLNVTDSPFAADPVEFHMGAKDGAALMGKGHRDDADVTLTLDYVTAADVFVSGNPQAGMQAFMAGKVKVQGDMTKLMAAGQGAAPGGNPVLQEAIREVTE